jgi:type VI secretion system protein ImpH
MADQNRNTEQLVDSVSAHQVFNNDQQAFISAPPPIIEDLGGFLKQYDFYAVMRLLESQSQTRFGTTKTPEKDPILLGQTVHMHFAPSSIDKLRKTNKSSWLDVFFFGLTGPNGPLPTHLTERIFKQQKEQRDTTTVDFLNIFHHRLLSLYYRAWANKDPIIQYDLHEKDTFRTYIGCLAGYGLPALKDRDSLPDHAKLKFTAFLGGKTRHISGLTKLIESIFGIKAKIKEFSGEWLTIPTQHRCILKEKHYAKRLGQSTTLGKYSWQCQYKFKVTLGPLDLQTYESFLPNTHKIKQLNDAIRNYVGIEFDWEIIPTLQQSQVPSLKLGQYGQLGWTSWLNNTRLVRYRPYLRRHPPVRLGLPKGDNRFYTANSFTPLKSDLPLKVVQSIHIKSQQVS